LNQHRPQAQKWISAADVSRLRCRRGQWVSSHGMADISTERDNVRPASGMASARSPLFGIIRRGSGSKVIERWDAPLGSYSKATERRVSIEIAPRSQLGRSFWTENGARWVTPPTPPSTIARTTRGSWQSPCGDHVGKMVQRYDPTSVAVFPIESIKWWVRYV
jgi:hypothetical protein